MDLSTATPVEIDTALAEIYGRYYAELDVQARLDSHMEKGLAKFEAGDHRYSSYTQARLNHLTKQQQASLRRTVVIRAEMEPYETEFRRRPWSRFFLVQNNSGHIHSSMSCITCYPTTRFGWLPNLSGQTEAEAVAAHGAILCTVCYPSAPTEYTDRHDDSVCKGTGRYVDRDLPNRTGYYSGNWGECPVCHERVTVTKSLKYRKHAAK